MGKQIAVGAGVLPATNKGKPGNSFAHKMGMAESIFSSTRFLPLDQLALGIIGRKEKITVLQVGGSEETAKATADFFRKEGVLVEMKAVYGNFAAHPFKDGVLFDLPTENKRIAATPGEFDYIVAFGVKDAKVLAGLLKAMKTGGVMFDDSQNSTHPANITMHFSKEGSVIVKHGNYFDEH